MSTPDEAQEKRRASDRRYREKNREAIACRRGLACTRCNLLIGMADDDPDLLRLIADNLESAIEACRARIAAQSQQLEMPLDSDKDVTP